MAKRLRVAMIAPPWLTIPPQGYGGIEEVVDGLHVGLRKLGVDAELFSVRSSRIRGVKVNSYFKEGLYEHIHRPVYESSPILVAHLLYSLDAIRKDGKFDIIHDHNGFLGPLAMHYFTQIPGTPPVVHTYHGPPFSTAAFLKKSGLPDNRDMWNLLGKSKRFFVVGLSESMMKEAPRALKPCILPHVHNAVVLTKFTFHPKKQKYFYTIGRFSPEKGNHIAAQLCDELGYTLKMAGTVAGINTPKQLILELSNPLSDYRGYTDFRYYSDKVWPITVKNPDIQYIGNICAEEKDKLIGAARAFLLPIDWEEPFGMVMIEALACGTPVVAMNRGSVPEIIEHGVNGFVANSVSEFKKYMQRVDEISPSACRESVEKRFSHEVMAKNYLDRYREVLARVK